MKHHPLHLLKSSHVHSKWRLWVCALIFVVSQPAAFSQDPAAASQTDVPPEIRARDDAVMRLIDAALALRINTGQTLTGFLASSPTAEIALREAVVNQAHLSPAFRLSNERLAVDAWIVTANLNDVLQRVSDAHMKLDDEILLAFSRSVPPVISATGLYDPRRGELVSLPGWRNCTPEQIELVTKSTRVDAEATLLARIARIQLTHEATVGVLLARNVTFLHKVQSRIAQLEMENPEFTPFGVCRQKANMTRFRIARMLNEAAGGIGDEGQQIDVDFSRELSMANSWVEVDGYGVLPRLAPLPADVLGTVGGQMPSWADTFLSARGSGKSPADVTQDQRREELAIQAARIAATRQLWLRIEALPLPWGETIGQLVGRDLDSIHRVKSIDQLIFEVGEPEYESDGTVAVTVGIRLQSVWRVLATVRSGN